MTRAVLQMVGVCALAMGTTMAAASACPGGGDKKTPPAPSVAMCPGGGDKKTPTPTPAPSIWTTPDRDRAPV